MKDLIRNCVHLTAFDATLPTVVTTDAARYGLGEALQKIHVDGIPTISFASQKFYCAECNYYRKDKEALAFLLAL